APPAVIFESPVAVFPSDVGPDGLLLFGQGSDILGVHLNGDGEASPWLATPATERNPAVSPDGDWVLYESDESGRFEVYLRRLGGSAGARPVSIGGGVQPAWSEDGRTLYYRGEQDLRAVDVDLGSSPPSLGSPRTLWPLEGGDFTGHRSYDTLPDGGFVAIEPMLANSRFQVIYNLGAELGRAGS
ncbi:MAG: hypothetical protein R3190_13725, partial [Thermoanaerobaculia bacterium]|nr:hypothetical protein [Thermoanaerobaculia bacterium]